MEEEFPRFVFRGVYRVFQYFILNMRGFHPVMLVSQRVAQIDAAPKLAAVQCEVGEIMILYDLTSHQSYGFLLQSRAPSPRKALGTA